MSLSVDASVIFYTDTLKEAWQQLALTGTLLVIAVVMIGLPAWLAYVMMRPSRRAALNEGRARRRREHEALQQEIAGRPGGYRAPAGIFAIPG